MSGVKEWFCLGSYRISNSIVRIFAVSARFDDMVNIGVVTSPTMTDINVECRSLYHKY